MVRAGFAHLLMLLMVGVLGVNCSGQDQEETEFPSLLTALGSKLVLADDYYDDDASKKDEPARPCCFPVVWQAALTICSPCLLVVALAVGGLYLRCRYPPTCSTLTAVANASPAT